MGLFYGLTPVHNQKAKCQPDLVDAQNTNYLVNKWFKTNDLIYLW